VHLSPCDAILVVFVDVFVSVNVRSATPCDAISCCAERVISRPFYVPFHTTGVATVDANTGALAHTDENAPLIFVNTLTHLTHLTHTLHYRRGHRRRAHWCGGAGVAERIQWS
jgi:hypothetical protein